MKDRIEILQSKKTIRQLLAGLAVFMIVWILLQQYQEVWFGGTLPASLNAIGNVGLVIVFLSGLYYSWKLLDKAIGLRIAADGIFDNSHGTSVGLIEWEDIIELEELEIASSRCLMVITNKPQKYIDRASNLFTRQILKANYSMYGSPIAIVPATLEIECDALKELITSAMLKHKN